MKRIFITACALVAFGCVDKTSTSKLECKVKIMAYENGASYDTVNNPTIDGDSLYSIYTLNKTPQVESNAGVYSLKYESKTNDTIRLTGSYPYSEHYIIKKDGNIASVIDARQNGKHQIFFSECKGS